MQNNNTVNDQLFAFRNLYARFSSAILKVVRHRQASGVVVERTYDQFKVWDGQWSILPASRLNVRALVPRPDDNDFPTQIADKCAREFHSSKIIKDYGASRENGERITNPSYEQAQTHVFEELLFPIMHTLTERNSIEVKINEIEFNLIEYIKQWNGVLPIQIKCAPLYNFDMEMKSVKLSNEMVIKPFIDRQKSELLNAFSGFAGKLYLDEFAETTHAVFYEPIQSPSSVEIQRQQNEIATKVLKFTITALRLTNPSDVGTPGFLSMPRLMHYFSATRSPLDDFDSRKHWFSGTRYSLDRNNRARFRRLLNVLKYDNFQVSDALALPLLQFNRSCQRIRPEDRIIDYAICLESTLLHDNPSELSYRLCLRAAVLNKNNADAVNSYEIFNALYKIRSKIVHENKPYHSKEVNKILAKVNMNSGQFIEKVSELIRIILIELMILLKKHQTLKRICEKLDSTVLSSLN